MNARIFRLDVDQKILTLVPRRSMSNLRASEPYDLEAWLASAGRQLFDREILWIARQDRPSDDQRSDLIGLDREGNLLVAELKKGMLCADGITQALAYVAEYASVMADELAQRYTDNSLKGCTATALVEKAASLEDATAKIRAHCGEESELNEAQIILLVAEDFDSGALAICDYLNESSGDASFSLECWRYSVFEESSVGHLFTLEQILPPPNLRDEIEQKREASKAKKYRRDPVRMAFVRDLLAYIKGQGKDVEAGRNPGQPYGCQIKKKDWVSAHHLRFELWEGRAYLLLEHDLLLPEGLSEQFQICQESTADGRQKIIFEAVDITRAKFAPDFGERLVEIVRHLKEAEPGKQVASPTTT